MALPGNVASTLAIGSVYLSPDDRLTSPLVDYEQGGVALNDPSLGLQVRNWTCWWNGDDGWVYVQPEGGSATQVIQDTAITEVAFSFDQNMNIALAYVTAGVLKFRWYDSLISGFTTTTIGSARSPRVSLDDKRPMHLAESDVILAYISGDSLYYRQQRDRYVTAYFLRDEIEPTVRLRNLGMSRNLRLQFDLA